MLVHLNCIKHCSSIHDYLFIAVKAPLHYGGACMYKPCRFIPNFKYMTEFIVILQYICYYIYISMRICVSGIYLTCVIRCYRNPFKDFTWCSCNEKICFCFDSSWHQHFHIWFRFSVTSALDQDGSFLHLQFDLWLVD